MGYLLYLPTNLRREQLWEIVDLLFVFTYRIRDSSIQLDNETRDVWLASDPL